jgi:RND family efflux transporter MFP subunit
MKLRTNLLTLLASGLWIVSCGGSKESPKTEPITRTVIARVENLSLQPADIHVQLSGTVEARTKTAISSQVMGVVRQMNVEPGQHVSAGQVLVVMDSQQLAAGAAQAEAGRLEARSALLEANAANEGAATQLELAKSTRARLLRLFERKSLAQQEMDEAEARVKQAEAAVKMAQAKRAQVEARIAQSEQTLRSAETQRGYATLTAPFAGIVTEKLAQVGSMAVPGAPLLTIERAGGYRAALLADEKQAAGIRFGMPLRVTVEDREAVAVRVSEIVPSLDALTRSLTLKADLPAMKDLRTGAFVRGEWTQGKKELLSVPASAVRENGQVLLVFVVQDGKAHSRMVSLGETVAGRREVLSGLKTGEKVVAELPENIEDGVRIEVKP